MGWTKHYTDILSINGHDESARLTKFDVKILVVFTFTVLEGSARIMWINTYIIRSYINSTTSIGIQ